MNVLWLTSGYDTGGQGARAAEAFRKHGDGWTVRSMAKDRTYLAYPVDLTWDRAALEQHYQEADVVHVRNKFDIYDQLAAKLGPKPLVVHWHGTIFRGNPEHYLRQMVERRAVGVVSTLDLWLLAPNMLEWLPAPYSVDWLASM